MTIRLCLNYVANNRARKSGRKCCSNNCANNSVKELTGFIRSHDRVILTIREHVGTEEAVGVGGGEGVGVDEPAVGKVVVPALEVIETRFTVVVIATVVKRVDVPDEGGRSVLHTFVIVHGVVAPRAVGAAAQRDAAGNDNDLWLCADGCTHHSDHLSISQRAVLLHRPHCKL